MTETGTDVKRAAKTSSLTSDEALAVCAQFFSALNRLECSPVQCRAALMQRVDGLIDHDWPLTFGRCADVRTLRNSDVSTRNVDRCQVRVIGRIGIFETVGDDAIISGVATLHEMEI